MLSSSSTSFSTTAKVFSGCFSASVNTFANAGHDVAVATFMSHDQFAHCSSPPLKAGSVGATSKDYRPLSYPHLKLGKTHGARAAVKPAIEINPMSSRANSDAIFILGQEEALKMVQEALQPLVRGQRHQAR